MDRRQFVAMALSCGASFCSAPVLADDDVVPMPLFYNADLTYSDLALAQEGSRVGVMGFMAPPLRAETKFFVLTRFPMAVCPFCQDGSEWPEDVLAIYTKRVVAVQPFNARLLARGVLELGEYRDPGTGFLSRVRITDAVYERV